METSFLLKKVARQPYSFFLFSNPPLNSTTDVKTIENSMKGLFLWKSVEIGLKTYDVGIRSIIKILMQEKMGNSLKYNVHYIDPVKN